MSDEELARELAITTEQLTRLAPNMREAYENLIVIGRQIELWGMGLGPLPEGVIVTREKRPRSTARAALPRETT